MSGTRRLASYALVPLAAVTLGGCARPATGPSQRAAAAPMVVDSPSAPAPPPAPVAPSLEITTLPADPELGVAYPFDLYSHCGIGFARFAGRTWRAEPPRHEPRPLPDAGGVTTYDGYTPGTMTLVSEDTARFLVDPERAADDGTPIVFHPTTVEPPLCE
jgi:hypothetical protein